MRPKLACGCYDGVSRREVLQGGLLAAVTALGGVGETMAQPAGKTGVRSIDIHAHYFPQAYFDLFNTAGFNSEFRRSEAGFFFTTPTQSYGPLPTKFIDLKQRLADMDTQGVTMHALSLTGPMTYWVDGKLSLALARTWNDAAVTAHQTYPDRFVVLATLPMLDPDRAIEELNRVSQLPGVRGVYMGTYIGGRDLDDPLFETIFSRIEALDLPIFLHPLAPVVGGKRLEPFSFTNLIAFPMDTTIAACFTQSRLASLPCPTTPVWSRTWLASFDMAFLSSRQTPKYANGSTSNLRVGRTIEAFQFRFVGRRRLHLPPDPHKNRERNRNHHRRTDS